MRTLPAGEGRISPPADPPRAPAASSAREPRDVVTGRHGSRASGATRTRTTRRPAAQPHAARPAPRAERRVRVTRTRGTRSTALRSPVSALTLSHTRRER
eukprot:2479626-Prymnesium_polylepis.3